jgi:hypothetical protein
VSFNDLPHPRDQLVDDQIYTRDQAKTILQVSMSTLDRLPIARVRLSARRVGYLGRSLKEFQSQAAA